MTHYSCGGSNHDFRRQCHHHRGGYGQIDPLYTEVLGLRLTNHFRNDWAKVNAGEGLTISIHPASTKYPAPGTKGAIMLGLDLEVPIGKALEQLARHGVPIKGSVVRSEPGNFATLEDPDGNDI